MIRKYEGSKKFGNNVKLFEVHQESMTYSKGIMKVYKNIILKRLNEAGVM